MEGEVVGECMCGEKVCWAKEHAGQEGKFGGAVSVADGAEEGDSTSHTQSTDSVS